MTNDKGINLKNKHILHCYVSVRYGGLESAFVSISNALIQWGGKVTIALQKPEGELLEQIKPNVDIVGLGYKGPLSYPLMLFKLIVLVRKIRPDIVISHSWNVNILALIAVRICRPHPKLILFEHTSASCHNLYPGWRSRIKLMMIPYLYRRADTMVVVSEGIKKEYNSKYHIPINHIHVITPPVDIKKVVEMSNEPLDNSWFNSDIPIIIGVATLAPAKDFITLIKAFAIVRQTKLLRLVLIGDGPERNRLENLAKELGINEDLQILGYKKNPYKYMLNSNIFALTSVVEGFGMVVVEAMALGLPVVSTKCVGPIDILENGKFGLLTNIGDVDAIAKSMSILLEDSELRTSLIKNGHERAFLYASENTLQNIKKLIVSILSPINREFHV